METETPIASGEITNSCTCTVYDEATGEYTDEPSDSCFGDCWELAVEDFEMVTEELRDSNETGWWQVGGLRLWNGEVGGYFYADKTVALIEGMTVNSSWRMTYEVFSDRIEYSLSHHDAPMGSSSVIRPVSDEEREEKGLY